MHCIELSKVKVTAVPHVEGGSLDRHELEHVDLVHFCVADLDKRQDWALKIQQYMQLCGAIGTAKWRPIDQAQAKIDFWGIENINRVVQIEANQIRVGIELGCSTNHHQNHVRPKMPVVRFVRIGPRRAVHSVPKSRRVKHERICIERYIGIVRVFATGQLRENHHSKLLRASHISNAVVAPIMTDNMTKASPWHKSPELRKQHLANIGSPKIKSKEIVQQYKDRFQPVQSIIGL